jgi:5'-nucleotidase
MSFGLLKVVPKDKNGQPVTDMKNQLIDIDPAKEGVQEAKEWISLIDLLAGFPKGLDGISLIPDTYRQSDMSVIKAFNKN